MIEILWTGILLVIGIWILKTDPQHGNGKIFFKRARVIVIITTLRLLYLIFDFFRASF